MNPHGRPEASPVSAPGRSEALIPRAQREGGPTSAPGIAPARVPPGRIVQGAKGAT
jgi:hypothetical protein